MGHLVIVQPRSRHSLVGQDKSQGLDQMQPRTGVRHQADDIARVRRNFRFEKYDMKHEAGLCRRPPRRSTPGWRSCAHQIDDTRGARLLQGLRQPVQGRPRGHHVIDHKHPLPVEAA